MPKRVKVTNESETGRNENFHDNFNGNDMTRGELGQSIVEHNTYITGYLLQSYHQWLEANLELPDSSE